MLNTNSAVLSPVYVERLVMDHEVVVVHQVPMFVVDPFLQPKVSIAMKIVRHQSYVEHHQVHINVRIHLVLMKNVAEVQPMSMSLMSIPNKFVKHSEITFKTS